MRCLLRTLLAVGWASASGAALVLMARGLVAGFYIENTSTALAEARWGARLVGIACLVLLGLATWSVSRSWPWWVAGGLAAPVVLCGGLTAVAPESLLPQLSVVVAFPAAVGAGIAGAVRCWQAGAGDGRSSASTRSDAAGSVPACGDGHLRIRGPRLRAGP